MIFVGGGLSSEIHREMLPRPVSGYVPEEIWKKAGEGGHHKRTTVYFGLCKGRCTVAPTITPTPTHPNHDPIHHPLLYNCLKF